MKITRIVIFALLALIFASCNNNTIYNEYKELPTEGWNKDSVAMFDVAVQDTTSKYQVIVNVRNRGDYPWQNLWLFVSYTQPNSEVINDTIECYLADNKGEWLGSGFGSLHEMPVLFRKNMNFKQSGNYQFSIQQGMRDSMLVGINDIGLEIIKAE